MALVPELPGVRAGAGTPAGVQAGRVLAVGVVASVMVALFMTLQGHAGADELRPGAGQDTVFGDDGEKFGSWPGTKDHVYTNGWLRRFFDTVVHKQGNAGELLLIIVVYSLLNFVVQTLIQPRFVGDSVGLSMTVTFIALLFWGWADVLGRLLQVRTGYHAGNQLHVVLDLAHPSVQVTEVEEGPKQLRVRLQRRE